MDLFQNLPHKINKKSGKKIEIHGILKTRIEKVFKK